MSESYWIFQIVKYKDESGFGLHEVYYNADDEPWGRTNEPEKLFAGPEAGEELNAEGLKTTMALMLADAIRHPVLEEPEKWAECPFQDALDEMKKEMGGLPENQLETFDLEYDARREEEPDDAL